MLRRVVLVSLVACGGHSRPVHEPDAPVPDEHWETVSDRRFVYAERCGVGPFEVEFPVRDDDWGRRVVMIVHTRRKILVDTRIEGIQNLEGNPSHWSSGLGFAREPEGDHARCRIAGAEAIAAAPAPVAVAVTPGVPAKAGPQPAKQPRYYVDTPSDQLPRLEVYTGALDPALDHQTAAMGWMPHGDPNYYADEYRTPILTDKTFGVLGKTSFRVRFWFASPADLDGVVFQFLDQRWMPDRPLAQYVPAFEQRVRAADAKREAARPPPPACKTCAQDELNALVQRCNANRLAAECLRFRERGRRMPPPPKPEPRPRPPGDNVDWIPGYWVWSLDAEEFVWLDGTYVVRAPKLAVAAPKPTPEPAPAPPPNAPATPSPPSPALEPDEPAHELDTQVAPQPAPRVEAIAPPPALPSAIWIAGHWRLARTAWVWIPGRWLRPPGAGQRFAPPRVRVVGVRRVYVPGRWLGAP